MPNGIAYGYIGIRHLFNVRLANLPTDVTLRDAVIASAQKYNEATSALLQNWVSVTTTTRERVMLPGTSTLQPLDEWGNPLPVKAGSSYVAGYPLRSAGTAWGTNRISRALMTVEEANNETMAAFQADADWNRRHILASVFDNVAWTYNDPTERDVDANIPVTPLANGDAVVYVRQGTTLTATTDNHYLSQTNPITNTDNPYKTLYAELSEHPGNTGPYVAYIPSNLINATTALAEFVPVGDPDIIRAVTLDTLNVQPTEQIRGLGDEVMGKVDRMWIVEWKALPDNYILARALGSGPFVVARDYPVPSLQGFYPEFHSEDGNLIVNRFLRHRGYAVRNRVAAVVTLIGQGSYVTPTGLTASTLY